MPSDAVSFVSAKHGCAVKFGVASWECGTYCLQPSSTLACVCENETAAMSQ